MASSATMPAMTKIVFRDDQRPEVEVLVGDTWHHGRLHRWTEDQDGAWRADVSWPAPQGERLDRFDDDRVRRPRVRAAGAADNDVRRARPQPQEGHATEVPVEPSSTGRVTSRPGAASP